MKKAIDEQDGRKLGAERSRLRHFAVRVAIVAGAIVLAGTATAAVDATQASVPGVTDAPGSVARAVLAGLGIEQRTDEEDAAADEADRLKDAQEREQEAATDGTGPTQVGEGAPDDVPAPAKEGIAKAKKNADNALTYTTAVRGWTACVAEKAPLHDPATGDFDPVKACGAKPTKPAGMGADEDETESEAAKENSGPPARVGPPAGVGPPSNAGPPSSTGPSKSGSSTTGPPAGAGPPAEAGPPAGAGPPADAGPPSGVGSGGGEDEDEDESEDEGE